ncbi:rsbT co-antagonist protein RsbR [Thermanaeromonas toyohensis ToBE]|uniref:RsbT co-antagonist protein RsbR n=1 Tax=Thermanaeromonas toyohensis ToBE TaxID=698762 RepID=A0A1W1VXP6_9FIRM|nr:STAS domain-containing protein [Thermanaeromonas toyohensis]SMB97861.1 rsbT co-antagonist protein RsbR [Thermanaeromonas toyohensis ToBE]
MGMNKAEELIKKLANTGDVALWRQLVEIPLSNLKEKEKETSLSRALRELIEELGEEQVTEKLIHITQEIPEYPVLEVMQQAIKVSASLRQEQRETLSQLRQMLSELATPIIRIWTDMLLVAMIGNIDSQRAQDIAEKLLNRVSSARAKVVIVDVTGVPMIDTVVGGFLIEMFNAIRLLGAEVILTGIKPEVAHTLVKLGVDFRMVSIARDLEDALRRGIAITMEEARKRRHLALTLAGSKVYENSEEEVS